MSNDKMRAAFEAWFRLGDGPKEWLNRDAGGEYEDDTEGMWDTWQGCSAIKDAEIARLTAELARKNEPSEAVIIAIENMVDQQLTASAMSPGDMFRLDGADIWAAAMAAA